MATRFGTLETSKGFSTIFEKREEILKPLEKRTKYSTWRTNLIYRIAFIIVNNFDNHGFGAIQNRTALNVQNVRQRQADFDAVTVVSGAEYQPLELPNPFFRRLYALNFEYDYFLDGFQFEVASIGRFGVATIKYCGGNGIAEVNLAPRIIDM